jgi:hypothetical protein
MHTESASIPIEPPPREWIHPRTKPSLDLFKAVIHPNERIWRTLGVKSAKVVAAIPSQGHAM